MQLAFTDIDLSVSAWRPKPDPHLTCSEDWELPWAGSPQAPPRPASHTVWGRLQLYNSYRLFKSRFIYLFHFNKQTTANQSCICVDTTQKKTCTFIPKTENTLRLIGRKKSFNRLNFIRTRKSQMISPFSSPSMCTHKQNSCCGQKNHQDYHGNKVSAL